MLKDGRKLGQVRLTGITTAVTDALYEKLLTVRETDADGNTITRERRTTVNHAMKIVAALGTWRIGATLANSRRSIRSPAWA